MNCDADHNGLAVTLPPERRELCALHLTTLPATWRTLLRPATIKEDMIGNSRKHKASYDTRSMLGPCCLSTNLELFPACQRNALAGAPGTACLQGPTGSWVVGSCVLCYALQDWKPWSARHSVSTIGKHLGVFAQRVPTA